MFPRILNQKLYLSMLEYKFFDTLSICKVAYLHTTKLNELEDVHRGCHIFAAVGILGSSQNPSFPFMLE